jgi:hypothetical protein
MWQAERLPYKSRENEPYRSHQFCVLQSVENLLF